eukprot:scaffold19286_cov51-Phaeocystis_antarctica.AAC.2
MLYGMLYLLCVLYLLGEGLRGHAHPAGAGRPRGPVRGRRPALTVTLRPTGGHAPGARLGPLQLRPVQARADRRHPGPCPRAPRHRIVA